MTQFLTMQWRLISSIAGCFFFMLSLHAQADYLKYYRLVNQGHESFYQKDHDQAVDYYQRAFSIVPYVHAANYARAARAAAKIKNHPLTAHYIRKAISQGYPPRFLQQPLFKKFKKSGQYQGISDSLSIYQQQAREQINMAYHRAVDSLYFIDQHILRAAKHVKGFTFDSTATYSDALNLQHLLSLMDRYGFPSEGRIGYDGYRKVWVVLHHNMRLVKNHHHHPLLLEALKQGDYLPENYCWVIDQGQELKGELPLYYHWDVGSITTLGEEDKKKIDQLRAAVGMPSIRRIERVKESGQWIQRARW